MYLGIIFALLLFDPSGGFLGIKTGLLLLVALTAMDGLIRGIRYSRQFIILTLALIAVLTIHTLLVILRFGTLPVGFVSLGQSFAVYILFGMVGQQRGEKVLWNLLTEPFLRFCFL